MLKIQKYLETHSFDQLTKDHGIYASFNKAGNKFSLNYDMIEAKEDDELAQECRGLILAAEDHRSFLRETILVNEKINYDHIIIGKTKIIAFGLKRFFNFGQGAAVQISWNNCKVYDKLDGTLIELYACHITNKWQAATRSSPEADIPMDNGIYTFRTLFEKALQETTNLTFDQFTSTLDKNITYCFELCTPFNRIVVNYPNNTVALIAARDLTTLQEISLNDIEMTELVPRVHAYALQTVEKLVEWVSTLNPIEHEGVIVCDDNFNRIKIKNAQYVVFSKCRDSLGHSDRNCLEMILLGGEDDVIPFLPKEIVDNLLNIKSKLQNMLIHYNKRYLEIKQVADAKNKGDNKTFALLLDGADDISWTAPLFKINSGKAENMKDFILKNKKNGIWGNSFLDKILEIILSITTS